MSRFKTYLAWRNKVSNLTPQEKAQLEINQWIWLRWVFTGFLCFFTWGGVMIYNEGHGFMPIHIVFFGMMLWATGKGWWLKILRSRGKL